MHVLAFLVCNNPLATGQYSTQKKLNDHDRQVYVGGRVPCLKFVIDETRSVKSMANFHHWNSP